MSYQQIFDASRNLDFQGRCAVAMWKAAQDIVNESDQTPEHAARLAWAKAVLSDTAAITYTQMAMQVLRNPTIAQDWAGASDGDIQYQVNSVLPDIIAIG